MSDIPTDGEIAYAVWLWRKRHKVTQQQMADTLDISRNYLSQIERQEANISLAIYRKIHPFIAPIIAEHRVYFTRVSLSANAEGGA